MGNERQLRLAQQSMLLGDCVECRQSLPDEALVAVKRPYRWRETWEGKTICPHCGHEDEWYFSFCPFCECAIIDEYEEEDCPLCGKPLFTYQEAPTTV